MNVKRRGFVDLYDNTYKLEGIAGLRDKIAESAVRRFGEPYIKVKDLTDLRGIVSDIFDLDLHEMVLLLPESIHDERCDDQFAKDIIRAVKKYQTAFFVPYNGKDGCFPSLFRKGSLDYIDHCGGWGYENIPLYVFTDLQKSGTMHVEENLAGTYIISKDLKWSAKLTDRQITLNNISAENFIKIWVNTP
jgi:hypothetical protein|nr:MAG TPA: hypothetical protein [Caudoviricetes sp.]